MILERKRDNEAWVREKTIASMKANPYLELGDIIFVAENSCFYKVVSEQTEIVLPRELFAKPIPASIVGNIQTASKLQIPRHINLTGDVTGKVLFDGSQDVYINSTIVGNKEHTHSDDTILNVSATKVLTDKNNRFVTDIQIESWNDKVGNQEFQTAINDIVDKAIKGATWKPPVNTFDDIATTYPNPKDTWTVTVMDTNKIYMYDAETQKWQDYGKMIEPNLNFTNNNPCINDVGGISIGTTFNNVSVLKIIEDMLYKKSDRDNRISKFYYSMVDQSNDYNLQNYQIKEYVKFPINIKTPEINNKYFNFIFRGVLDNGDVLNITDLTLYRISDEIQQQFNLNTNQIEMENAFDFRNINIGGENYILIASKKVLSGTYEFLLTYDKNKTFSLANKLMNRINELESKLQ